MISVVSYTYIQWVYIFIFLSCGPNQDNRLRCLWPIQLLTIHCQNHCYLWNFEAASGFEEMTQRIGASNLPIALPLFSLPWRGFYTTYAALYIRIQEGIIQIELTAWYCSWSYEQAMFVSSHTNLAYVNSIVRRSGKLRRSCPGWSYPASSPDNMLCFGVALNVYSFQNGYDLNSHLRWSRLPIPWWCSRSSEIVHKSGFQQFESNKLFNGLGKSMTILIYGFTWDVHPPWNSGSDSHASRKIKMKNVQGSTRLLYWFPSIQT